MGRSVPKFLRIKMIQYVVCAHQKTQRMWLPLVKYTWNILWCIMARQNFRNPTPLLGLNYIPGRGFGTLCPKTDYAFNWLDGLSSGLLWCSYQNFSKPKWNFIPVGQIFKKLIKAGLGGVSSAGGGVSLELLWKKKWWGPANHWKIWALQVLLGDHCWYNAKLVYQHNPCIEHYKNTYSNVPLHCFFL